MDTPKPVSFNPYRTAKSDELTGLVREVIGAVESFEERHGLRKFMPSVSSLSTP
jgi:hypothetical protein